MMPSVMFQKVDFGSWVHLPAESRKDPSGEWWYPLLAVHAGPIKGEVDDEQFGIKQLGILMPAVNDALHFPRGQSIYFTGQSVCELRIGPRITNMRKPDICRSLVSDRKSIQFSHGIPHRPSDVLLEKMHALEAFVMGKLGKPETDGPIDGAPDHRIWCRVKNIMCVASGCTQSRRLATGEGKPQTRSLLLTRSIHRASEKGRWAPRCLQLFQTSDNDGTLDFHPHRKNHGICATTQFRIRSLPSGNRAYSKV
jgi:hypothetical protein